ncbi:MAG: hypothetical protein ACI364_04120 [Coriobacteriales bacterium]
MKDSSRTDDDEFIIVHRFMLRDLELKGLPLLLYARVYGFCCSGSTYYESRPAAARALNTTPRSLIRAANELTERGLIVCIGNHVSVSGSVTKEYVISEDALDGIAVPASISQSPDKTSSTDGMTPPDELAPPDDVSPFDGVNPDGTSGYPVTGCHPIRKG